jgi:hypothetical protein
MVHKEIWTTGGIFSHLDEVSRQYLALKLDMKHVGSTCFFRRFYVLAVLSIKIMVLWNVMQHARVGWLLPKLPPEVWLQKLVKLATPAI